jgi:hypothetical protein
MRDRERPQRLALPHDLGQAVRRVGRMLHLAATLSTWHTAKRPILTMNEFAGPATSNL